jgi:hypothetical protein
MAVGAGRCHLKTAKTDSLEVTALAVLARPARSRFGKTFCSTPLQWTWK